LYPQRLSVVFKIKTLTLTAEILLSGEFTMILFNKLKKHAHWLNSSFVLLDLKKIRT
jgi:hypothetical protein